MSNTKKQLNYCNALLMKAKLDRDNIFAEGRSDRWTKEKLIELEEKYTKIAAEIKNNLIATAKDELALQVDKAKTLRNRPGNHIKQTDSAAKLYHLTLAKMALDGLSEDEAIQKYPDILKSLADHEKEHLHVYEDVLLAHCKADGTRELAEHVILENLPVERKLAEVGAMRLREQLGKVESIAAHVEHDIENIIRGKSDLPEYDYTHLLDTPKKAESPPAETLPGKSDIEMIAFGEKIKIPYDAGFGEVEGVALDG